MIVYHASENKNLTILTPQKTLSKNVYIGDYVFATKDRLLATMYLATRGLATLMGSNDEHPNIVICAEAQDYVLHDKGGAIYELPNNTFTASPQVELADYELVSTVPVKPVAKIVYETSLAAIQNAGIEIKFTDQATFDSLIRNPRQKELIKQLPSYINNNINIL